MDQIRAQQFGQYIQDERKQVRLSARGLCRAAGIDIATLVRLEQGKLKSPRPTTLTSLADALGLPHADVFAMAGYSVPYDLPSLTAFLRSKYTALPEYAVAEIDNYFQQTMDKHGIDLNGPLPGEDEDAA